MWQILAGLELQGMLLFGLALGYKSVISPICFCHCYLCKLQPCCNVWNCCCSTWNAQYPPLVLPLMLMVPLVIILEVLQKWLGMRREIREITDALDAAENTTAAIGKDFAIESAAFVSLALFGVYVSRAGIKTVNMLTPKVFIGVIVGAMLPYWFSAMKMKCVGNAALKMVEEVRRQFNTIIGLIEGRAKPDYATRVKISTDTSLPQHFDQADGS